MKNDGGPAFPGWSIGWIEHDGFGHPGGPNMPLAGMSLRDYFAGQALAGLAAHGAWDYSEGPCNSGMAKRAFVLADAMLVEGDKEEA